MGMYFIMKKQTIIFSYIWSTVTEELPAKYANRMEFNEDGTIKTLVPDEKGVGYLAVSQEQRENKALKASFSASSVRSPVLLRLK